MIRCVLSIFSVCVCVCVFQTCLCDSGINFPNAEFDVQEKSTRAPNNSRSTKSSGSQQSSVEVGCQVSGVYFVVHIICDI